MVLKVKTMSECNVISYLASIIPAINVYHALSRSCHLRVHKKSRPQYQMVPGLRTSWYGHPQVQSSKVRIEKIVANDARSCVHVQIGVQSHVCRSCMELSKVPFVEAKSTSFHTHLVWVDAYSCEVCTVPVRHPM